MTGSSYEQLATLVAAQERIIAGLQVRIAEQDPELAGLRRQLRTERECGQRSFHGISDAQQATA